MPLSISSSSFFPELTILLWLFYPIPNDYFQRKNEILPEKKEKRDVKRWGMTGPEYPGKWLGNVADIGFAKNRIIVS